MKRPTDRTPAVSPVLGVILLVAVTVILSTTIGVFVFDLSDGLREDPQAGVSFEPADDGTVEVQLVSMEASHVTIEADGAATVSYHGGGPLDSIGDGATVARLEDGDRITVLAHDSGAESVVQTYTYRGAAGDFAYSDWSERTTVSVSNPNDEQLVGYQVKVEVNHRAEMQDDFSDLRFTQMVDGEERDLDYWIEEYTAGDSATVWVQAERLPANFETELLMHYGNSDASSLSDGDATFRYFDDFSTDTSGDWTFGETLWERDDTVTKEFIWDTANNRLENEPDSNSDYYQTYDPSADPEQSFVVETSAYTTDDDAVGPVALTSGGDYLMYGAMASNHYDGADTGNIDSMVGWTSLSYDSRSGVEVVDYGDTTNVEGGYTTVSLGYDGDTFRVGFDGTWQSGTYADSAATVDRFGLITAANSPEARYDWWRVRSYADEEPTVTVEG